MERAFVKTIDRFIKRNQLLKQDHRYLVALSGGADSVALLTVLRDLGYHVEAVHCNFHLRGEESDRDETFCRNLCDEMGVSFHLAHFDTATYAATHHVSIEMAARELRYHYFEQLRRDLKADGICVGHHQNDAVETVLINLLRGTGLHGLKGIAARNGFVLRPLLCVTRDEIVDFLSVCGQSFVTDSSNNVADVVRNKVRLQVLPLLETINPSVSRTIAETAGRLAEADKLLTVALEEAQQRVLEDDGTVSIPRLLREPSPEYVLFHLLSARQFTSDAITQIADYLLATHPAQSGKRWFSSTTQLVIDRERLLFAPIPDEKAVFMRIPEPGVYVLPGERGRLKIAYEDIENSVEILRQPSHAMLDAAHVVFPLTLRQTTVGDRFVPLGMQGSKLVSDFLTNQKRSIIEKQQQLVLVNGNDDILWLVGNRLDHRYRCNADTRRVLHVILL